MQELDDLQGLSQAEQVRANRTAQAARSMRYPLRLSAYSYELLTTFLQAHRLALPLGLLNEHISLQVRDASSSSNRTPPPRDPPPLRRQG